MRYKVLVTATYLQPIAENYRAIFASHQIETIVPPLNEKLCEAELLQRIGDIDGIIAGNDEITEKVLLAGKAAWEKAHLSAIQNLVEELSK